MFWHLRIILRGTYIFHTIGGRGVKKVWKISTLFIFFFFWRLPLDAFTFINDHLGSSGNSCKIIRIPDFMFSFNNFLGNWWCYVTVKSQRFNLIEFNFMAELKINCFWSFNNWLSGCRQQGGVGWGDWQWSCLNDD